MGWTEAFLCCRRICRPPHLPDVIFTYLGNMSSFGLEDTGEPFAMLFDVARGLSIVSILDENDHTAYIYQEIPVPTINPNYLTDLFIQEAKTALDCNTSGGSNQIQPDWNQNDSTKPDHIKNRIAYETLGEPLLDSDLVLEESNDWVACYSTSPIGLEVGATYIVVTDSGTYTSQCTLDDKSGCMGLGNWKAMIGVGQETNDPFMYIEMYFDDDEGWQCVGIDFLNGTHMSIYSAEDCVVHKLDPKYLPEGGFGYSVDNVLTYNGVINDKYYCNYSGEAYRMVKISDDVIDLKNIDNISVSFTQSGVNRTENINVAELAYKEDTPGNGSICDDNYTYVLAVSTPNDRFSEVGTYVMQVAFDDVLVFVNKIVLPDTTHPIDQKFLPETVITKDNLSSNLPGICLPLVEIADLTAITEAEAAALDAVVANMRPFCLLVGDNGAFIPHEIYSDTVVFSIETKQAVIEKLDGKWAFVLLPEGT